MRVNRTYRYLEEPFRAGPFTISQLIQFGVAASFAIGFFYISPLSLMLTAYVGIILAGLPLAAGYAAMGLDFSIPTLIVSFIKWQRRPHIYQPGCGQSPRAYYVEPVVERAYSPPTKRSGELSELWEL